jgi:hypothetical protein
MPQVVLFADSAMRFARPLSIYRLATHLRAHNISVKNIWGWKALSPTDFYNICKKFISTNTLVVGISTTLLGNRKHGFFGVSDDVLRLRLQLIRKLAPNAKIIVGGSQVAEVPISAIPARELVDVFVTGQGEESLLAIVQAVQSNTRFRTASISPPIVTQDIYPYSNFSNSKTEFVKEDCIVPGEGLGFEFARGCIFKCSFCTYELTGKTRGDYSKSYNLVREELIANYNNHGTRHYNIVDDLLNDSEDKVNLVLDVAESLPFKIYYSGFIRLDMLRRFPSMATKLKDSGLISAFMGIETVNDPSGKAVGKGLGRERIDEALNILKEKWNKEVLVESGLILGLPHDTTDTKHQVLEWLQSSPAKDVIQDISINALSINRYRKISEIDKDPGHFGYTITDSGWTTDNYNSIQASADAKWVIEEHYRNRKYNKLSAGNNLKMDLFTYIYLLSISDRPQDIMDVMLYDRSSAWKDHNDWNNYVNQLFNTHRERYLNLLLEKT